jgi:hypothetical protein
VAVVLQGQAVKGRGSHGTEPTKPLVFRPAGTIVFGRGVVSAVVHHHRARGLPSIPRIRTDKICIVPQSGHSVSWGNYPSSTLGYISFGHLDHLSLINIA